MTKHTIKADYFIAGSGAVGMAFADVILSETDASIVIADRYAKPGGHWNVAYPFVTLHQPSAYYGVSSVELSKGRKDQVGLNKGLNDLASGAEVSAYYDDVMRHQFLPTGRVQYFPMCEWQGGNGVHRLRRPWMAFQIYPVMKRRVRRWRLHGPIHNVPAGGRQRVRGTHRRCPTRRYETRTIRFPDAPPHSPSTCS